MKFESTYEDWVEGRLTQSEAAASMALPPDLRTLSPASVASAFPEATMPREFAAWMSAVNKPHRSKMIEAADRSAQVPGRRSVAGQDAVE